MLVEHNKNLNERNDQERKKSDTMAEQLSKQKIRIHRMEATIRKRYNFSGFFFTNFLETNHK